MALTAKKVYAILKRQISDMEAKIKTPIIYRGTVATADLLPLNPDIGDMYNIESKSVYGEAGMNVAWNGIVWDTMGAPIDMSLYIKSSELADWVKQQNKPTYTAEEVGALPADTKIPSKTSDLQNDSGFLTKIPDNYLSGTDKTLSVSGKAADAKTVGDKNVELLANILSKLDKNQGSENSGKIAGINESGDIVPMFPVSVDYNEETNCLEFGSDQKMELNKGINIDSTLTKTGYAADAGTVGEITNSLKEDIDNVEDVLDIIHYQIFDDYLYHNYYLEKNGQYTQADGWNVTKLYPVPPHTTIFFSANVNSDDERTLNNIARDLIVFSDNNRTTIIAAYDFYNAYTNETDKTVYIQASIYGETNPTYKVKNLMIQYGTPEILPYKKYGALRSLKIENLEKQILYDYDLMGIGDSLMAGTGGEGVSITKECASILGLKSYGVFGFGGSLTKDIGFTFGAFTGYIEPNKSTFKIKNADLTADIWIANNQLNGKTVIVDDKEYIVTQTAKDTFSLNGYTPQNIYVPIHTKESEYTSNVYLIWCGTNDRGYKWDYLEAIVKRIPNKKYVILGLTKYGTDTTVASEAIGMNTYGSHFFNTRLQIINNAFKVLDIEPTTEDVEKMNNGLMPPSLLSDETHFNSNGYKAIGILLAKHIKSLNYFN